MYLALTFLGPFVYLGLPAAWPPPGVVAAGRGSARLSFRVPGVYLRFTWGVVSAGPDRDWPLRGCRGTARGCGPAASPSCPCAPVRGLARDAASAALVRGAQAGERGYGWLPVPPAGPGGRAPGPAVLHAIAAAAIAALLARVAAALEGAPAPAAGPGMLWQLSPLPADAGDSTGAGKPWDHPGTGLAGRPPGRSRRAHWPPQVASGCLAGGGAGDGQRKLADRLSWFANLSLFHPSANTYSSGGSCRQRNPLSATDVQDAAELTFQCDSPTHISVRLIKQSFMARGTCVPYVNS